MAGRRPLKDRDVYYRPEVLLVADVPYRWEPRVFGTRKGDLGSEALEDGFLKQRYHGVGDKVTVGSKTPTGREVCVTRENGQEFYLSIRFHLFFSHIFVDTLPTHCPSSLHMFNS